MFAFMRLVVMGFVILTVVYICLSLYARARERERLERRWVEEGMVGDRRAFVRAGLDAYGGSLRRRMILGVYVVPVVVIGTIIYIVNHSN
ncbi:MAG: hypothetical protein JJT81_10155 [Rubellimicrobium sp.]|nr:hypothetical protein [Rubellimicrobium sp.]